MNSKKAKLQNGYRAALKAKDKSKGEDRCDAILKSLQHANSRCLYQGTKENAE